MSIEYYQNRIESVLTGELSNVDTPEQLREAMQYSTLGGGKRVRALLVYAVGEALAIKTETLDPLAVALEMIHAYSLIHDDLPAMDDDELRRGKATNHIQFNEATAILAGDALLTLAFEIINRPNGVLSPSHSQALSYRLATKAGRQGMVGGQILDILATQTRLSQPALEDIHRRKTGALINAAITCPALCVDESSHYGPVLESIASNLGLAFQVVDDILDVESSTEILGKKAGADQNLGKSTFPALIGLQESKQLAENLYQQAIASIDAISDNSALLKEVARMIVRRTH